MVAIMRFHRDRTQVAVTLSDETLTVIDTIMTGDRDSLSIQLANAGNVLDQFEVAGQVVVNGTFEVLFNAAADFTSPAGILIGASGDLTILADAATGWLLLYPKGFYGLRIRAARAAGANTILTMNSGGS